MNNRGGFCLKEAASMCAPYVDSSREDYDAYNAYSAKPLIEMPQFPDFAAWYFSQDDLWGKVEDALRTNENHNRALLNIKEMKGYTHFKDSGNLDNRYALGKAHSVFGIASTGKSEVRPLAEFALTLGETKKSLVFFERNPDFLLSMVAIKMCAVDYFETLKKEICFEHDVDFETASSFDTLSLVHFRKGFNRALANAKGFSFIQDMATIMVSDMDEIDEKSLHLGVHQCFAKGVFESTSEDGVYNKCPFAEATSKILQMTFKENGEGELTPVKGQRPGSLIMWVRNKIQEKLLQPLPNTHPIYSVPNI